ncbi:MAG: glycyl-radical enzyme activating protein [Nitrososphaeria archaeon]
MLSGVVFNIERCAIHDGPGIRTLVFLQGCPLACLWCQNPEGQSKHPVLLFFENRCVKCFRCLTVCPTGATSISEYGKVTVDRVLCRNCFKCVEVCPSGARRVSGRLMSSKEVVYEVEKDFVFYRRSGGGITLSGGEPTAQPEFAAEVLRGCKTRYIHTCIETCGYTQWEVLEKLLDYTDLVLYDIKHMNEEKHVRFTGVSNRLILANAKKVVTKGVKVVIRVPLITGFNDDEDNVRALAEFVKELGVRYVDLLPYHRLGVGKYKLLQRKYSLEDLEPPTKEHVSKLRDALALGYGLDVSIHGGR